MRTKECSKKRSHSKDGFSRQCNNYSLQHNFKFFILFQKSKLQIFPKKNKIQEQKHEIERLSYLNNEKQRQIDFLHNTVMKYEYLEEKNVEAQELYKKINNLENELENKENEIDVWKDKYESFFSEANSRMELIIKHYDLARRKYEKEIENQYENERKNDLVYLKERFYVNMKIKIRFQNRNYFLHFSIF